MSDTILPAFALATAFLEPFASTHPASAEVEQQLVYIVQQAQTQWPTVAIASQTFVAFVAKQLLAGDPELSPSGALEKSASLCTDDLYLSCACLHKVPAALAAFDAVMFSEARKALSRFDKSGVLTEEILQELRWLLFVRQEGSGPKIATFQGTGQLSKWVQVSAVGLALNAKKKQKRQGVHVEHEVIAAIPDIAADPELAYIRQHYGDKLQEAMRIALGRLSSYQRAILKSHFVDKRQLKQIATVYQVHPSTITRQLQNTQSSIVQATREILKKQLAVQSQDLLSILRLVPSEMTLGLRTIDFHDDTEG